jgi:paired amphipathic helix protein Sin3a
MFNRDQLTIELLGDEDFTGTDESKNSEIQWTDYIDNYVKFGATENELQPRNRVFLNRTRTDPNVLDAEFESINNLECKISVNTYKMFFVENSEDSFRRKKPTIMKKALADGGKEIKKSRHLWMKKFLETRAVKVFGTTATEWTRSTQRLDKWFLQGDSGASRSNPVSVSNFELFGVPCRQFISQSAMRI